MSKRARGSIKHRTYSNEIVKIGKLVHGGQGLGLAESGKKIFVWGALPGETVEVQVTKSKKDWAEGFACEVIESSPDRITPKEPEIFMATSPWQILDYNKEAECKQQILADSFAHEVVTINWQAFYQTEKSFSYRNKMEYNFWYCKKTERVSLALHQRSSHQKIVVNGSMLATEAINKAGQALIKYVNDQKVEARSLKSVILRSDHSGQVGISLFVKNREVAAKFAEFKYPNSIFEIFYSNPKNPASITTEVLKESNETLADNLLGKSFKYTTRSFFQVNIPVYEEVLGIIKNEIKNDKNRIIDMYSGVGSIGLSVVGNDQKLTMIETSQESTDQAKANMLGRKNCEVITTTAETALGYITGNEVVIVDPPRPGLHKKVTEKLVDAKASKIIYLSCNPSTQARDVKSLLSAGYKITFAQGFNFFPRTPHIESLVVLKI